MDEDNSFPCHPKGCVRCLPDCPSNGILYKDVTGGLLLQPFGLSLCIALIMEKLRESDTVNTIDAVLAPEAMAFLFAGPVASSLQKPVVLARKSRRLPGDLDSASYEGSNITNLINKDSVCSEHTSFHIAAGSIVPGQKVLIVDDCLASGATLDCLVRLVHTQGGEAKSLACVMELPDMGGHAVARDLGIVVLSLFQFDGRLAIADDQGTCGCSTRSTTSREYDVATTSRRQSVQNNKQKQPQ